MGGFSLCDQCKQISLFSVTFRKNKSSETIMILAIAVGSGKVWERFIYLSNLNRHSIIWVPTIATVTDCCLRGRHVIVNPWVGAAHRQAK